MIFDCGTQSMSYNLPPVSSHNSQSSEPYGWRDSYVSLKAEGMFVLAP